MKRVTCIILLLAVVMTAVGCGGAPSPVEPEITPVLEDAPATPDVVPAIPETPEEPVEEPMVGMPNPMVQYEDMEALQQEIGTFVTIPDQSADAEYFMISGELAHITFTYEGLPYVLRLKKTDAFEDISGVYGDMTVTSEQAWGDVNYQLRYIEGEIGLSQWYDEAAGYSYSIFMESSAGEEALIAITQSIIPVG
ncbi:MAG: hypothetical protein PHO41_04640 [Eubacteriales bacterium]|nr:hypothetical protein [Eubacteriales bacterium]